jgi:hypothetical protein
LFAKRHSHTSRAASRDQYPLPLKLTKLLPISLSGRGHQETTQGGP